MGKQLGWLFVVIVMISGCKSNTVPEDFQKKTIYALNTIITIDLMDQGTEILMNKLVARIHEIEADISSKLSTSQLAEIEKNAGKNYVPVSEDTYRIIEKALEFAKLSKGKFDPTIGPIIRLWGIGTEEAKVPTSEEIKTALTYVDYQKVHLNEEDKSVYLEKAGMSLELGGIAKGYVADALIQLLEAAGTTRAMLSLGGNIYAYGEKTEKRFWRVAIQNPYGEPGSYFGYLEVKNKTVVTSGAYERYLEVKGKRYAHIFNALTGYPVEGEVISVTVVGENSMAADALSTILFTLPIEEGLTLIEDMPELECIYVDKEKKIYLSSGLENSLTITDQIWLKVQR